jgi:hypothetical protein
MVAGRGRLRRIEYVVPREELTNLPVSPGLLREIERCLPPGIVMTVGHSNVRQRLMQPH